MLINSILKSIARMKRERGGILVPFAIVIPILIILIALAINAAKMFISKGKLSDVSAEVGLIVSATNTVSSSHNESKELAALIQNYVKEFFPNIVDNPIINIKYSDTASSSENNTSYMTYQPQIQVKIPYPYYSPSLSGKDKNFTINTSPLIIKKEVARPIDIVFAVDFSTSQQGSRIRTLKQVFDEITKFITSSNEKSQVAVVPFSTGVAIKYPETNQRGGLKGGCSVLFVPKKEWAIDYGFWGDKFVNARYKSLTDRTYYIDRYRKEYYTNRVARSRPAISNNVVFDQWCRKNPTSGVREGRMDYSCFDNRKYTLGKGNTKIYTEDIFTPSNLDIISKEYATAAKVRDRQNTTLTIEHDDAIDYEATLDKMFGEEAIITFPMLWTGMWDGNFRIYKEMCHNTGWWDNFGQLADARLRSWLIELTHDQSELDQFQKMEPQGWTATTSGLIRSVPVMMKGRNPRKIFVIMSDGEDSTHPAKVTDKYLKKYNLCQRIKDGILDRPETNAERVDIYYVSTTDDRNRVKYWADYCVGEGNAAKAVDRKSIVSVIKGFISDEIGSFTQ